MAIESVNPATGERIRSYEPLGPAGIEERLGRAEEAFRRHRRTSFAERAARMLRAAEILETEKDAFGRLMTLEMGKTLREAVAEAAKCAWTCRHYAEQAERYLADETVETDAARSFVRYGPLGPILAVMPWNFPFWQVVRFAAPALMAGNTGLLKHASNVPGCALALEDIFARAGFTPGAFQALLVGAGAVEGIIADPRVRAATLTGSEPAGSRVAAEAGRRIKKTVLELGGCDPFIVTARADIPRAAEAAVRARIINNGQSCIAAKRFIVDRSAYAEFERRFLRAMEALKVGDPMDPATDVGPLAREDVLEALDDQVRRSAAAGARILTGGRRIGSRGWYYSPTVLAGVPRDSPAAREETFGPVAALFPVAGTDEAVDLANDTSFGLGASVWTSDPAEGERIADGIEAGVVVVNGPVVSDPRLPFGGLKASGYGRELGAQGIREFAAVKTIVVRP
jgi:succinate-semialdehyde dehydrogenase/glutarate-semialdehyde dehydrogenase